MKPSRLLLSLVFLPLFSFAQVATESGFDVQLGAGWYVGNGDMVIRYDWDANELYVPIGVRLGKVIQRPKSAWNLYVEYQTSLIYDEWSGSAVENSLRLNVTYTLPVGN